ncbi:hypothetical protein GGF46_004939 [Coemansia sp. RSA 552]|nr:hypothetical protein GGF46_004939 [Coemansia sp. RSA 552]
MQARLARIVAAVLLLRLAAGLDKQPPATAATGRAGKIGSGRRLAALGLYRHHDKEDEEIDRCKSKCKDTLCRGRCERMGLTEEKIVRRTQKCNEDCKDQPNELIQMCIQRCTYYLIDPDEATMEMVEVSSTDDKGMLIENHHIHTRVRMIGPDGLPLKATPTPAPAPLPAPVPTRTTAHKRRPQYRVELVNKASGRRPHLPLQALVLCVVPLLI